MRDPLGDSDDRVIGHLRRPDRWDTLVIAETMNAYEIQREPDKD